MWAVVTSAPRAAAWGEGAVGWRQCAGRVDADEPSGGGDEVPTLFFFRGCDGNQLMVTETRYVLADPWRATVASPAISVYYWRRVNPSERADRA